MTFRVYSTIFQENSIQIKFVLPLRCHQVAVFKLFVKQSQFLLALMIGIRVAECEVCHTTLVVKPMSECQYELAIDSLLIAMKDSKN